LHLNLLNGRDADFSGVLINAGKSEFHRLGNVYHF